MLPGRLTTEHIEAAIARGDGYISYKGRVYTIKELREMDGTARQRIEGVPTEPQVGKKPDESASEDRAGSISKRGSEPHEKESPERKEPPESGSKGTSE